MKENNVVQQTIEICHICADVCKSCANRWKKDGSMETCVLVCRITAARCEQVLMYAEFNDAVFEKCAEACSICARECEKHNDQYCRLCAEMCRKCAGECLQMAA